MSILFIVEVMIHVLIQIVITSSPPPIFVDC